MQPDVQPAPLPDPGSPDVRPWRSLADVRFGLDSIAFAFAVYWATAVVAVSALNLTGWGPRGEESGFAGRVEDPHAAAVPRDEAGDAVHVVLAVAAGNLAQLAGGACCLWYAVRRRTGSLRGLLRAHRATWSIAAWSIGGYLLAMASCYAVLTLTLRLIWWVTPTYEPAGHRVVELIRTGTVPAWGVLLLWGGAVIIAPLAEELFFRGLVQTALGRLFARRSWAIILTAALFGLAHMSWSPPQIHTGPPMVALGVLLGAVYERTDALAVPVAIHVLFNLSTMVAVTAGWDLG